MQFWNFYFDKIFAMGLQDVHSLAIGVTKFMFLSVFLDIDKYCKLGSYVTL